MTARVKFSAYPGCGDDLDALARRRPGETTVVIFEPCDLTSDARS